MIASEDGYSNENGESEMEELDEAVAEAADGDSMDESDESSSQESGDTEVDNTDESQSAHESSAPLSEYVKRERRQTEEFVSVGV